MILKQVEVGVWIVEWLSIIHKRDGNNPEIPTFWRPDYHTWKHPRLYES